MTRATLAPPTSPYKGLAVFGDSELDALLFFGREREREIVAANLLAYRLTVLYGASGVGKSSVLRAGVAYHLRSRGEVVVVFSSWGGDPVADILEQVRAVLVERFGEASVASRRGRFADSLATWCSELGCDLYLILDQVDEYFLYHEDDDSFEVEFAEAATREGLSVNFLLAIRDDMLSRLDRFKSRIPNLFSNYLRLDHLDRQKARSAIVGPVERWNALVPADSRVVAEPELVEAVLDQTAAGRVELAKGVAPDTDARSGRLVEAPYLQLVMERLWDEERRAGSSTLRLSTLERLGGAEEIARAHLRVALDKLGPNDQDVAASLFDHLVTPSGTKIAHSLGDLAQYATATEADVLPVLTTLVDERIVRPVQDTQRPEGVRYEIFHDVLAEPVSLWRARHEADRTLRRERSVAERRHRRLLALTIGSLGAFALMAVLAGYAVWQRGEAREQADRARGQALIAEANAFLASDPIHSLNAATEGAHFDPTDEAGSALRSALVAHRLRRVDGVGAGGIVAVDFARTGSLGVAAAGDGDALVFGAVSGRPIRLLHHGGPIVGAGITDDSRLVYTVGKDGTVVLWSPWLGRRLGTFRGGAPVTYAAREQNDVIGDQRGVVRLITRGSPTSQMRTISTPVAVRQAFVDEQGLVALVVGADGRVRIYDLNTGRLRHVLATRGVTTAALSPRGRYAATAGRDGVVRLWHVSSGRPGPELLGHELEVTDLEFDALGTIVVSSSLDGTARVWRVPEGELVAPLVGHKGFVDRVAVSPTGDVVATASVGDGTVRLWRTRNGEPIGVLPRAAIDLRFGPGGVMLATGGSGGKLRLWDASPDPTRVPVGVTGSPVVAVAARAERILGAGDLGRATVWHSDRAGRVSSTTVGRPVLAATFGSRPLVLVGGAKGTSLWDAAAGVRLLSLPHRAAAIGALNQPGRVAATARGRDIRVWDADGRLVGRLDAPQRVSALALSANGSRVAAGGVDGKLWVWDVPSRTRIATREHGRYPVRSIGFDRSGRLLVTTAISPDIQAQVWETATWRPLYRPFKHFGSVAGASFSPDGRWLATAGPRAVWIWDLRTGRLLFLVQGGRGPLTAVTWTSGNRVVTGSGDTAGTVATYVCGVCGDTPDLLRAAESMLARSRAG